MSEEENPQEESSFTRSRRSYVYESGNKGTNTVNRRTILIVVGIAILVLLVIVAVFASGRKGEEKKIVPVITPTEIPFPTEEPTETPGKGTPTPKASPTPKPTLSPTKTTTSTIDKATGLDRANLTIAVKNGSGVTGAAAKASNFLKDLGYTVSSTGNADNSDYENTVIEVKSTKKVYLDLLKKDLGTAYTIGSTSALLIDSSADAVVIIGKK